MHRGCHQRAGLEAAAGTWQVTLTEMRIAVVNVYKNRINLAATLKDTKTVVSKLERMVGAGLHLVAILFYLAIWNVRPLPC